MLFYLHQSPCYVPPTQTDISSTKASNEVIKRPTGPNPVSPSDIASLPDGSISPGGQELGNPDAFEAQETKESLLRPSMP
ncbi:unnamed protein product [Protopolystoma xenopodis]|uniref:Uncharacterized protein n=1 Tax=Protopolystoma xenopodis TaxID=117903 RepID=A0A448WPK3_9PLAT|nr:unnamed protein product [Protopolystoma xenopodis]